MPLFLLCCRMYGCHLTPVIDVMDAGLRDNFGEETTFTFSSKLLRLDKSKIQEAC